MEKVTELVSLKELAIMLEKPVQMVYLTAQEAKAFRCKDCSNDIFIDVEVFQNYLDKVINEKIRKINNKPAILEVCKSYDKLERGVIKMDTKNKLPKELLWEFERTCKEVRAIAAKKNVDLSKITFCKR